MTIPADLDGERFDKALAQLASLSRSAARRLIDSGEAGIGSLEVSKARDVVSVGDSAWYRIPSDRGPFAEPLDIGVVHEDEHLVVVDKPSGMVTHPGAGLEGGTLVSALLHRWPAIEGVGEHPRWGIVHRLDRETSGLLVVAKSGLAHRELAAMIKKRDVTRQYWALAHGRFEAATGTIDAPIERLRARQVVSATGRRAVTHYRRLAFWAREELTLLEVSLETGRTHQIRVHLGSIDHHVVGDRIYGRPATDVIDPGRVWLHARRLAFTHPMSGDPIDVANPVPTDLGLSLATLGAPTDGAVPEV